MALEMRFHEKNINWNMTKKKRYWNLPEDIANLESRGLRHKFGSIVNN
jgi:hypothetical protein